MRILVLTLMMSFLGQSVFGAEEGLVQTFNLEKRNEISDALTLLLEKAELTERERNTIIELKKLQEHEDDDCGPSEEVRGAFEAAEGVRVKCDESNDISDALTLLIDSEGLIKCKSLFEKIKLERERREYRKLAACGRYLFKKLWLTEEAEEAEEAEANAIVLKIIISPRAILRIIAL